MERKPLIVVLLAIGALYLFYKRRTVTVPAGASTTAPAAAAPAPTSAIATPATPPWMPTGAPPGVG